MDKSRRKVLRLLATSPLLSGTAAGLLGGCDRESKGQAAAPGPLAPATPHEVPWAGLSAERSLIDHLSFASLHRDGLMIDFGSTDSFKYTFGGWRSGWGKHVERDGVAYTHATTKTSRVHFHWDTREALTVRFRIRREASRFFSLHLNSKAVEKVDITRVDWTTYESRIPAELVNPGTNHMLLRWEATTPAMGEDVAAAVDFIQIAPEGAASPSLEALPRGITTGAFIANGYVSGKFGFEKGWDAYTNYIRENKRTEAEHVFADAMKWIEQKALGAERFYAYVHTIDPHVPYDPPESFLKLYEKDPYRGSIAPRSTAQLLESIKKGTFTPTAADKRHIRALYDGEISYHDRWFGDFMDKLDEAGVLEDTVVIVVSDHGEEFWEHGNVGHGHQIHQELIHVPFIMNWRGSLPAGTRVSDNQDHGSLVPTLFDAMGLEPPAYLEGNSLLGIARGEAAPAPAAGFSTHQGEREATWCGRYKLLQRGPISTSLFDVDGDPSCQNNLKTSHPIALTAMRAVLGQFQGAPNKARWRSRELERGVAMNVTAEDVEMDATTREQLKALGYFR